MHQFGRAAHLLAIYQGPPTQIEYLFSTLIKGELENVAFTILHFSLMDGFYWLS